MENPKAPADTEVAGGKKTVDWAARFQATKTTPPNPKTPFDPDIGQENHDISALIPPPSDDDPVYDPFFGKDHCYYDPLVSGAIYMRSPVIKEVISSHHIDLYGDDYDYGPDCVSDGEDYGPDCVSDVKNDDFDRVSDDENEDEDGDEDDDDDGYHTPEDCVFDSFAPGKVCPPAPKAKRARLN